MFLFLKVPVVCTAGVVVVAGTPPGIREGRISQLTGPRRLNSMNAGRRKTGRNWREWSTNSVQSLSCRVYYFKSFHISDAQNFACNNNQYCSLQYYKYIHTHIYIIVCIYIYSTVVLTYVSCNFVLMGETRCMWSKESVLVGRLCRQLQWESENSTRGNCRSPNRFVARLKRTIFGIHSLDKIRPASFSERGMFSWKSVKQICRYLKRKNKNEEKKKLRPRFGVETTGLRLTSVPCLDSAPSAGECPSRVVALALSFHVKMELVSNTQLIKSVRG